MATSWNVRTGGSVWRMGALAALVLVGAVGCEKAVTSASSVPSAAELAAEETGTIRGRVVDQNGNPVPGATVRTPDGRVVVTNANGEFEITGLAPTDRLAVTVEAPGFTSNTAIYQVVAGQTLSREIRVLRRPPPVRITAGVGGVIPFAGSGRVSVPAYAFAGVAPGEIVNVQVSYFDPRNPVQLSASPGNFAAVTATGETAQLETFGEIDIRATSAQGTPLDLAPGQRVRVNFPDTDGPALAPRGLWTFDTTRGVWVAAGNTTVARDSTIVADLTTIRPTWNVDDVINTVCIQVQVLDAAGLPRAFQYVTGTGASYWGFSDTFTDANGIATLYVRSNSQVTLAAGPASITVATPSVGCPLVATLSF